ncbi:MAG: tetratricopeptide repeat protein [Gammaproteobacteria bacterium]|nr:tetratricopeptide repeat protein [Gammaproteobacteria bacterium]
MISTSVSDSTPSLQTALHLQQSGNLGAAEKMYHVVLQANPACADAWHLLGLIALQRGEYELAIEFINSALHLNPQHAVYHFNLGHVYKRHGALQHAAVSYRTALAIRPDDSDALNNLGGVLLALDEVTEALHCFTQALQLTPHDAQLHCNSGHALLAAGQLDAARRAFHAALNVDETYAPAHHALAVHLQQRADFTQAQQHYQRALQLAPEHAALHIDFGTWHQTQDRLDDAAACYRHAITLDADAADAWNNLGAVQQAQGELQDAVRSYTHALRSAPEFAAAHKNLASAYHLLGKREHAIEHYHHALRLQPDYTEAEYELAALTGDTRAAPPPDYVAGLFDQYAHEYDAHMTGVLGYNVPQQLRALVEPHLARPPLAMLDLGCGTGLSGAVFHDLAHTLIGIDLSPKMISRARERDIYDQLCVGDVVSTNLDLNTKFDLILAADVFVYLGDLAAVFAAVREKLLSDGLFAFSVELGDEQDYVLRGAGRYAHAPAYVRTLAAQHGFIMRAEQQTILRKDYGSEITGVLWLLQIHSPPHVRGGVAP